MLFSRRNRKNSLPDRSPARQRANRREHSLRQRGIRRSERHEVYDPYMSEMIRGQRQRRRQAYVPGASRIAKGSQRRRRQVYVPGASRIAGIQRGRRQAYVPGASGIVRGSQRRRRQVYVPGASGQMSKPRERQGTNEHHPNFFLTPNRRRDIDAEPERAESEQESESKNLFLPDQDHSERVNMVSAEDE